MTSQDRFFSELEKVPRVATFWDKEKRKLQLDAFEVELGLLSSGEAVMAKFFAAVWFHNDRYLFDIVEAGACLDNNQLEIIKAWLNRPYWP